MKQEEMQDIREYKIELINYIISKDHCWEATLLRRFSIYDLEELSKQFG